MGDRLDDVLELRAVFGRQGQEGVAGAVEGQRPDPYPPTVDLELPPGGRLLPRRAGVMGARDDVVPIGWEPGVEGWPADAAPLLEELGEFIKVSGEGVGAAGARELVSRSHGGGGVRW